jgi:type II secretory pathway pseudopilin PulG
MIGLRQPRRSRRALTLVELFVVVAILLVLLGLLLPAVQRVRDAGNRIQCSNNLKQIGLAFASHHEALGALPMGGGPNWAARSMAGGFPRQLKGQAWGWGYQILPYLDQVELWRHPSDAVVRATPIPQHFCPTRRKNQVVAGRAMNDYAGNQGSAFHYNSGYWDDDYHDGTVIGFNNPSPLRMADLTDGISHTILVGEKRVNLNHLGTHFDDDDGYVTGMGGWGADAVRGGYDQPAPDYRHPTAGSSDPRRRWNFGSSHPGIFQVVFADGAVRAISYQIKPLTFRNLCNRHAGNAVEPWD